MPDDPKPDGTAEPRESDQVATNAVVDTTPQGLPRALTLLIGGAAAVIIIAGLRELAFLVGPVFLAFVIVSLVHPLHTWMLRRGLPKTVALLLLLVAIYAVVIGLAAVLAYSVARLASILPDYSDNARAVLNGLINQLSTLGIDRSQLRQAAGALDLNRLAGHLTTALSSVISFGANLLLLLSLLLFLGVESAGIGSRLQPFLATRPRTFRALAGFTTKTRRFLSVTTVFAVIVGVADTLLLLWLDVPLAALWGLLAAVCNYIPYVGFVIGLVPPALLSLLGGDWRQMVLVIVAYVVLNSLVTSLLPPYFVGDAVGLSIIVTLLSVLFWAWVLGPLGAVLAVPLTLLVKAVLIDADPRAAWAEAVVGSGRTRSASRTRRRA